MRRMTISMDDDLADLFDEFMAQKGYTSRSEAIRDLLRGEMGRDVIEAGSARECVGALSYVYNHHERQLGSRLVAMHHEHHDVTVAATHAHLDHDNCIETVILRGPTQVVTQFAESVIAQKGVRHGKFNVIPVDADKRAHTHGPGRATSTRTCARAPERRCCVVGAHVRSPGRGVCIDALISGPVAEAPRGALPQKVHYH